MTGYSDRGGVLRQRASAVSPDKATEVPNWLEGNANAASAIVATVFAISTFLRKPMQKR